jgi:hypothetical protein
MHPTLGQAGFRIGMFVLLSSGALLLVLDPGTAEHALMVFTFVLGLIFTLLVFIMVRIGQRRR